jgi:predicted phosphoribosyltransferase
MPQAFQDRRDGGRELAGLLGEYADRAGVIVLALPRGGVPVGFEVAKALNAPLDVFLVRKLGVPGHEELAMGAVASGGLTVLNQEVVQSLRIPGELIERAIEREKHELARRELAYRGALPAPDVFNRTVILVDDGLATGSTMRAAIQALREEKPACIVVAVPVAAQQSCHELGAEADRIVCARTPVPFHAVGLWYQDFIPTTDQEVRGLLERARAGIAAPPAQNPVNWNALGL